MDKLLNLNYSYNFKSFKGDNGTWTLVGVEGDGKTQNCIDTFKSEKGIFIERARKKIKKLADEGKITPIESSRIIIPYEDDKKLKRRAV